MQNLKNFIRHGKQARDRSPESQPGHFFASTGTAQQQYHQHSAPVQVVQPQPVYATQQQQNQNRQQAEYNEAAAKIVAEEREARSRLPRYPGLERFKLLDKMGEYIFLDSALTLSGAFSAVYKAQNRETGQMVAIKVVRKHELNASQVCPLPHVLHIPFLSFYSCKS
jgi:serine/threonine-protein kinase RCK2